eukprot:336418_1
MTNKKQNRRKRKLKINKSSDTKLAPKPKKQKKNNYKDDYVKPYKQNEIEDMNVKELKKLLRKQHFPVSGTKQKLIARLTNPKQTIHDMKYSYHRMTHNSHNCVIWTDGSISVNKLNQMVEQSMQFNPKHYIFQNGKIIERSTVKYGYPYGK